MSDDVFELAPRRFEDNRRFAARRTKEPSLLQGLIACRRCGYAYFRAPKVNPGGRRYVYYCCAGTLDAGKRRGGRVCHNRSVRQDHLDALVWEHVTRLMSDPALIRRELDRRLEERWQGPAATSERSHLRQELSRNASAMRRLLVAYEEGLVLLDELRDRMPELRRREKSLSGQIESLDNHLANEETYLKLAETSRIFSHGCGTLPRARPCANASRSFDSWSARFSWIRIAWSFDTRFRASTKGEGRVAICGE